MNETLKMGQNQHKIENEKEWKKKSISVSSCWKGKKNFRDT